MPALHIRGIVLIHLYKQGAHTLILFDHDSVDQRISDIDFYAGELVNEGLLEGLNPPEYESCTSDDFDWLGVHGNEIANKFFERFKRHYTHFKTYHGARPENVGSYLKHGLIGQDAEKLHARFKALFSHCSPENIDQAIENRNMGAPQESGSVFFTTDKECLTGRTLSGRLVFGSEYFIAIGVRLGRLDPAAYDYRDRIKSIGIPTIFEIHLPFELLSNNEIKYTSNELLAAWGNRAFFPEECIEFKSAHRINCTLPPQFIVDHWHPSSMADPDIHNYTIINEMTTCDYCNLDDEAPEHGK